MHNLIIFNQFYFYTKNLKPVIDNMHFQSLKKYTSTAISTTTTANAPINIPTITFVSRYLSY